MPLPPGEITTLLSRLRTGDSAAEQQLAELVYDDLRKLAHQCIRGERVGHTMQATALLHEVWLTLVRANQIEWQDRAHFFALAARTMRRVLVESARARQAEKRGGGRHRVELTEGLAISEAELDNVLLVDSVLKQLVEWDARQADIVEMRYFGGLTEDEIAALLGLSVRTVKRDWKMAKGWLALRIRGSDPALTEVRK